MLCRLLLMRHAKSSQPSLGMSDHERPLDSKGSKDAPVIAQKLVSLGYVPQLVLCSDSRRTSDTWGGMASLFSADIACHKKSEFYESDTESYIESISKENFTGHTLLLIGHNPVIEDLLSQLTREPIRMKPAFLAILEIHADTFADAVLQNGLWKTVQLITP